AAAVSSASLPVKKTSESPMDRSLPDASQREHVVSVLLQCGGNKARAARSLGVSRRTLYRLLERHEISLDSSESQPPDAS
ncbi:MAG: helix-turn-helix domain-containing protein, partial [Planctomycetales bacterium]|nr:helix-turn-helix domain-containing protein [Planctomycetales bacterium]